VALILLTALEQRELHGYALHRRVEELSEGLVQLDTGTLYRWLARFNDSGWVDRREASAEEGDERRRYYSLTPLGQQVLALERARLERLLSPERFASEAT
jgi:DNA-binding PadR family transcriptional regulator